VTFRRGSVIAIVHEVKELVVYLERDLVCGPPPPFLDWELVYFRGVLSWI